MSDLPNQKMKKDIGFAKVEIRRERSPEGAEEKRRFNQWAKPARSDPIQALHSWEKCCGAQADLSDLSDSGKLRIDVFASFVVIKRSCIHFGIIHMQDSI